MNSWLPIRPTLKFMRDRSLSFPYKRHEFPLLYHVYLIILFKFSQLVLEKVFMISNLASLFIRILHDRVNGSWPGATRLYSPFLQMNSKNISRSLSRHTAWWTHLGLFVIVANSCTVAYRVSPSLNSRTWCCGCFAQRSAGNFDV